MPPATISIPLRAREKPIDLPEEYRKSLRNELHVRYLESIGAAPTKANLALIRKAIPPEKCNFQTAWKSRGWVSDTLYISLEDPTETARVKAVRRAAAAAADLAAIDRLPAALLSNDLDGDGIDDDDEEEEPHEVQLSAPGGAMSFADAQQSFLYPYKHVTAPKARHSRVGEAGGSQPAAAGSGAAAVAAMNAAAAYSPHGDADDDEDGTDEEDGEGKLPFPSGTFDFSSRDAMRFAPFAEREIYDELAQPLELHTKDITKLQADFLEQFPFDRLIKAAERNAKGGDATAKAVEAPAGGPPPPARLASMKSMSSAKSMTAPALTSQSSMAAAAAAGMDPLEVSVRTELSSARTARFIGILALFLYWSHMPERCQVARDPEKLAKLLCAVQQYFAALRRRMMKRRNSIMLVLPTLLLSARATVEALFRSAYKKWWTTLDGKGTLAAMDRTLEEVLDPCAYHTHIAPLESTTDAIKIAAHQELGVKPRGSTQARMLATSTLISTALPQAPLVQNRRTLLAGTRLPEAEQQMTELASASVRHTLLKAARTRPSAAEATAQATRLVDGMIARPAPGASRDCRSSRGGGPRSPERGK